MKENKLKCDHIEFTEETSTADGVCFMMITHNLTRIKVSGITKSCRYKLRQKLMKKLKDKIRNER